MYFNICIYLNFQVGLCSLHFLFIHRSCSQFNYSAPDSGLKFVAESTDQHLLHPQGWEYRQHGRNHREAHSLAAVFVVMVMIHVVVVVIHVVVVVSNVVMLVFRVRVFMLAMHVVVPVFVVHVMDTVVSAQRRGAGATCRMGHLYAINK